MAKDIGVLVVAHGIEQEVRERFETHLKRSNPQHSYELLIMGSVQRKGTFNKCKLLNKGLKKLLKNNHQAILQTDIDLIIPPKLIDKSFEVAISGRCCNHVCMRRINIDEIKGKDYDDYPWQKWKKYKRIYASGCWNMMKPNLFEEIGGWNEWMIGWGEEDAAFRRIGMSKKIKWKDNYRSPLVHIDHPKRTTNQKKHNRDMEKKAKKEGKTNWL